MPKVARQVGYLTGYAARYLTSARNRFAEFARDTELTQVPGARRCVRDCLLACLPCSGRNIP